MTSKLETELVKASGFKPPKGGYKERQDHLAALARLANKLTDEQFDELSDDAANWVTATIHSIRDQEEIKDFDDADEEAESADEAGDSEDTEGSADEPTGADDDDGTGTDPEDDAEAESENEATEAAQARKAPRTKAVASKSAKGAKPSPRQKAEPEGAPKKKERITTTRYDNIDGSKDRFGLVIGTKTWEAVQMYEKGCTTAEIKEKLGGRYYNILKILEERGHRVERFPGGKFKVTHAEDRKRKVKE